MNDDARRQRRLRRAEKALVALVEQGNPKRAADHLGVSEKTVRRLVSEYCLEHGYDSPVQAAYWLGRL